MILEFGAIRLSFLEYLLMGLANAPTPGETSRRNEFLIASHHPLRETLMLQTGMIEQARRGFLNNCHIRAKTMLIPEWEPAEVNGPAFDTTSPYLLCCLNDAVQHRWRTSVTQMRRYYSGFRSIELAPLIS